MMRLPLSRWLVFCVASSIGLAVQADDGPPEDDAQAHALYDQMIKTMRDADSLSFESDYRWESQGRELSHVTYRVWLKKPNQFRVEASRFGSDKISGVLVGDGDHLWVYWPGGKPRYGWEESGKYGERFDKYKDVFYIEKPAPQGKHSIAHEVGQLGAGMCMTILDLSMFHGYVDCMQKYLDGVRMIGDEVINGEPCDQIEVSIMKHQRSWFLWLSRSDHLPRKLKEIVRVSREISTHETWSRVTLNAEIPAGQFAWSPPEGWEPWTQPRIEEGLLQPGVVAPDFKLAALDSDKKIGVSDFRGNFVWLYKWRCG
jgi:outer membrane lipoprotein-sorting protein